MIWLSKTDEKERDIITCNMIVLTGSRLKMIEELKKELLDSKNYILSGAEVIRYSGDFLFDVNDGIKRIENQKIACVNGENIYVRRYYTNPRRNCFEILSQVGLSKEEQLKANINLLKMFNGQLAQIDIIAKSCIGDDCKEQTRFFMNNLWQDFYFFAKAVLDVIEFEEIASYDILDLEDIQRLCRKNNVQDNCSEILCYKDVASSNGRILSLAKKINDYER